MTKMRNFDFENGSTEFDLENGTVWTHVGYIASKLCKYLHPLIAAGD
jgi:hypothetical protein